MAQVQQPKATKKISATVPEPWLKDFESKSHGRKGNTSPFSCNIKKALHQVNTVTFASFGNQSQKIRLKRGCMYCKSTVSGNWRKERATALVWWKQYVLPSNPGGIQLIRAQQENDANS